MPKKTTSTQQQRARQEQWRRRVESQMGGGAPTKPVASPQTSANAFEDVPVAEIAADSEGYQQAEMRQMPTNVTTSSAATRNMSKSGAATMPTPTASQRRAIAASRAARSRVAMNTMSLEEEMHYVRADIRKLIILTVFCLAIIIALAFVLNR